MRNTKAGAHWDENWQVISDFPDLILEDNSMEYYIHIYNIKMYIISILHLLCDNYECLVTYNI